MPQFRISVSRIGLVAVAASVLAACGSDVPETIQYPTAAPVVDQVAAQGYGPPPPPPQPAYGPAPERDAGPVPGSDGTLAAMVESAIAAEPELNTLGIDVSAVDGTVYLRGQARTRESRRLATEVASSVDGVKRVQNELFILAGAQPEERRIGDLAAMR